MASLAVWKFNKVPFRYGLLRMNACQFSEQVSTGSTGSKTGSSQQVKPPPAPPKPPTAKDDNQSYLVTDYYGHTEMSYYDFELDMQPYRLEQPSKYVTESHK